MRTQMNTAHSNQPKPAAPAAPVVTPAKPVQPINVSPAPQTISKNRAKSEYMTPELEKVSEKRRQAEGMKPVAKGTPNQMPYLMKNKDGKSYMQQKLTRKENVQRNTRQIQRHLRHLGDDPPVDGGAGHLDPRAATRASTRPVRTTSTPTRPSSCSSCRATCSPTSRSCACVSNVTRAHAV